MFYIIIIFFKNVFAYKYIKIIYIFYFLKYIFNINTSKLLKNIKFIFYKDAAKHLYKQILKASQEWSKSLARFA